MRVSKCRICGNPELIGVLELGQQALTGVFPKDKNKPLTSGPLTLLKCDGRNACGLLQLAHSYSLDEMYGENYGYRSGLNPSMVQHLRSKVERIKRLGIIDSGDIIVDIGSNDGTTLRQYELADCVLIGIDPTGAKFRQFYGPNIELIPDFFSADAYCRRFGDRSAKVVTSFAMFYDLENPLSFMEEVAQILDSNGVWVFEQSYMPAMLATNSYDTICHEHLEYYSLSQIMWMAQRAGLKIVDVELNNVNGGSFSVTAQKLGGRLAPSAAIQGVLAAERAQRLDDLQTYVEFGKRVGESKRALVEFLEAARNAGKTVAGLGASTKGNVILQYCGIDSSLVGCIGEINPDKFGAYTPGTRIQIVDERELLRSKPDYALVLPWHFRKYFESQARYAPLRLVYPLPLLSGV